MGDRKYLAWTMAGEGHRTAAVERELIGGSCPNIACMPSKNVIHSAKVRSLAGRAASPQFTHAAYDDFRVVRDNLHGGSRTTTGRLVPYCMFLDPELARVGCNETQARRRGIAYRLLTLPMAAVRRARTLSEPRGFLKMLIAADSDQILGFTAFGAEASELMAAVQVAMMAQMPYTACAPGSSLTPPPPKGSGTC